MLLPSPINSSLPFSHTARSSPRNNKHLYLRAWLLFYPPGLEKYEILIHTPAASHLSASKICKGSRLFSPKILLFFPRKIWKISCLVFSFIARKNVFMRFYLLFIVMQFIQDTICNATINNVQLKCESERLLCISFTFASHTSSTHVARRVIIVS